ncbi:MAG: SpaA isopeptide-forming pilin-related protein [Clostridia bacterium]|nr:SpaA isopeptide-forming pilin-related protein [Clostridia bacterium]
MKERRIKKSIIAIILVSILLINNVFAETLLNTKIEIINHKLSGINILNIDTLNQNMQGTTFRITNKDTAGIVGEYMTDSKGSITVENLVQGNYQVVQLKTLDGYELNSNIYDLKVEFDKPNTELKVINELLGNIKIVVKDSKTNELLKEAKFLITNIDNNASNQYTSDDKGEIFIEKTTTATYTIEQLYAPEYYEKDSNKYTIQVVPENTIIQEIQNQPYSDLNIYSLDNYNDNPLVDTKFKVTNLDTNEIIGEYLTNDSGKIEVKHLYPANYKIEQISVDSRYDSYSEIQTTKIELSKDPTDIYFYSNKLGGIHIIKKNIDNDTMQGVKFRILKNNDDILGEYETNENGEILVEYLQGGDYKIQEIYTLPGYYLDPTIYNITVKNQEKDSIQKNNNYNTFRNIIDLR